MTNKLSLVITKKNYGDPWGNRTPVTGVRGRCLNRLTNGPSVSSLALPTTSKEIVVRLQGFEPGTH